MQTNTVIQGDCLEYMKTLPDKCIDLVLTDPPYKFEVHGKGIASKRKYMSEGFAKIGSSDEYDVYNEGLIEECMRICKKPNMFFFCNKSQLLDIFVKCKELGLNWEIVVFCKTSPTPLTNNQWLPDKEYGVHCFKSIPVLGNYDTKRSFFVDSSYKDGDIDHPTAKPLHIIRKLLSNLSNEGGLVLDCFSGSGSTGVACKEMGRQYILVEKEPKYIDIINKRLSTVTPSLFN